MKPNGVYMVNIIDNPKRGDFLRPYVNTLRKVFPHVTIAAMGKGWNASSQNTLIIVASNDAINPEQFNKTLADHRGGQSPEAMIMPEQELTDYLKGGTDMLLTDDRAPVDQLMATLFDERGY
ncbi:MAG TPA: fused MFS/spermidine synthase, partial [Chloroflexota bacterium]|nr:fused MFS/spermidine synthase [Chloroflexota bacterium]